MPGGSIRNVVLMLTDAASGSLRMTRTSEFGYYSFAGVAAGGTYVITARGKRFTFAQPSQVLNINDNATDVNFIGNSTPSLRDF